MDAKGANPWFVVKPQGPLPGEPQVAHPRAREVQLGDGVRPVPLKDDRVCHWVAHEGQPVVAESVGFGQSMKANGGPGARPAVALEVAYGTIVCGGY